MLGTHKPQAAETQGAKPTALEMNPYSENFNPGKYFACTRKVGHTTVLIIAEDNEAVIKIIEEARSMALRHLPRTHRIDVHWLFEVCANPQIRMLYVNTKQQIADLMTKSLNNPQTWEHLLDIAQIRAGITSQAGNFALPALLTAPPGLALPLQAACCPDFCSNTTGASGAGCLRKWN